MNYTRVSKADLNGSSCLPVELMGHLSSNGYFDGAHRNLVFVYVCAATTRSRRDVGRRINTARLNAARINTAGASC
jgi:hypothetical protein